MKVVLVQYLTSTIRSIMTRKLKEKVKGNFRKENTRYSSEDDAAKDIEKSKCDFIVEGQTEEYYLNSLQMDSLLPYTIAKIYNVKGNLKKGFYEKCQILLEKLFANPRPHIIICLFDLDLCYGHDHLKTYNKYKSLLSDYKKEIAKKELLICDSLPSIEYWFLSHFVNKSRYMTSDAAISDLIKYIPAYGKADKNLSSLDWSGLNTHLQTAIKSQSKVSEDSKLLFDFNTNISYSNIYKIFQVR